MYMGLIRKTRRTVDLDPLVHDHLGDMVIFGAHYWAGVALAGSVLMPLSGNFTRILGHTWRYSGPNPKLI